MKHCYFKNTCVTDVIQVEGFRGAFNNYILGYCVTNYLESLPLCVRLTSSPVQPFFSGLGQNSTSSCSVFEETCHNVADLFRPHFPFNLVSLSFISCSLVNADLFTLSQLIPHVQGLKMLCFAHSVICVQDGLLSVLLQLFHSNVTSLDLTGIDFTGDRSEHCYSALKKLISPPSGKLDKLSFGGTQNCDKFMSLISGSCSLSTLCIYKPESWISGLCSNTCITRLELKIVLGLEGNRLLPVIPQLMEILKFNKTLIYLGLSYFKAPHDINALRNVTDALSENSTLKNIEMRVWIIGSSASMSCDPDKYVSEFMQRWKINLDPRITWRKFP